MRPLPPVASATSLLPPNAVMCRGVKSSNNKYKTLFKQTISQSITDIVIKSSQTTQLYITKVSYEQFSSDGYMQSHFSSEMFIKLTFYDWVEFSHD